MTQLADDGLRIKVTKFTRFYISEVDNRDLIAMDEQEFRTRSNTALEGLQRKLTAASDRFDFEPDFNAGALSIEFEEPKARFVVSPNTPVRQIWVSAHSKSFKLDWDTAKNQFVLSGTGQTLDELIASAISTQVGQEVRL